MNSSLNGVFKNRSNILMLISILFILYFTLLPHVSLGIGTGVGLPKHELNLNPFAMFYSLLNQSLFSIIVNDLGNIILFVPLGFTLPLKWTHLTKSKVVLIGCLSSIMIELIQLFIPNRCTDIDDVILNTLGTFIGYLLLSKIKANKIPDKMHKK
jgi:glycopeptide antibiotics resistance protein